MTTRPLPLFAGLPDDLLTDEFVQHRNRLHKRLRDAIDAAPPTDADDAVYSDRTLLAFNSYLSLCRHNAAILSQLIHEFTDLYAAGKRESVQNLLYRLRPTTFQTCLDRTSVALLRKRAGDLFDEFRS